MLQIFILAGIGVLAMLSEVFNFRKIMPYITRLGAIAAIVTSVYGWGINADWFNHMLVDDNYSQAFILVTSIVLWLWLMAFRQNIFSDDKTLPDYAALISFAVVGGFIMCSYTNLAMLFLGIEILSIPVYVLAGANRKSLKSNESAFKYFLMGAFASGILLFGMAFVYGATGSFDATEIAEYFKAMETSMPTYFSLGMLLIIFALSFKLSAVPFHYWTPDVYEGAPTAVTAFMATMVKAFAAAAAFRLFFLFFPEGNRYIDGFTVFCMFTMILGNIFGAVQDKPKRVFAYSSIGHAGFMLMAIIVGGTKGAQALLYYIFAYSIASLLSFVVLSKVVKEDDFYQSIGDFKGLSKRNGFLAIAMTVALLSMAGIPPLSGFFAKYFMFSATYSVGNYILVIVAIIASLIGVYYYFKFITSMYSKEADEDINWPIELNLSEKIIIVALIGMIVFIGIMPDLVMDLIVR
jgi:NADH-quinone oxidoreductase subunit N